MIFHKKEKKDDIDHLKEAISEPANRRDIDHPYALDFVPEVEPTYENASSYTTKPTETKQENSASEPAGFDETTNFNEKAEDQTKLTEDEVPYTPDTHKMPFMPSIPDSRDAPLFVKVDKYKEVLSLIQEMKVFISGIKQLFNILQDLEALRIDAIKIMKATIQRLERRMIEMDSDLLRPKGYEAPLMSPVEAEASHVEDSLTELQGEIARMRRELEGLK